MAITYPLAFPTYSGITSIRFNTIRAAVMSQSPFSFKQQTLEYPGERWEADITLPPMKKSSAKAWIGWLCSLNGHEGTFLMGDPDGALPLGSAGGTPLVAGASQTGRSLNIDGATASQTGWLKAGDYIQLGSSSTATLHMVLQDADSDGGGNVQLDLFPKVRTAPADNSAVVVTSPKGLWRLKTPNVDWDIRQAAIYGLKFSVVEAI